MSRLRALAPVLRLFWAQDRRMLLAGMALSLATAIAGIGLLGLSGWFITATAIAGASLATALAFDVFMPSAGIRLLALGRTASRYGERLATHEATLRILSRLRERLFRGWARGDAAGGLKLSPSRLLFRLTLDIDALDSLYLRVAVPAFAALGTTIVISAALGLLHPLLGLGAGLVLLTAGLGVPALAARRAERWSRRRAHALEALRSRTIDLVRGQTDLLMAGRLQAQVEAVGRADARLAEADRGLNAVETDAGFGLAIAGAALLGGILLAVAVLAEAGTIGAPAAALAVLVGVTALEPFAPLRRGAVELGRTLLAARRVGPQLDAGETGPSAGHEASGAVRLRNVTVAHAGAAAPVLSDLSIDIGPGERLAVLGQSGAGKSTLLALLAGDLAPSSGRAAAGGSVLLTQHSQLFRDTLRGNLELAAPGASDTDMLAAMEAAGLGEFVARLPRGLDATLGEGGLGLSAGQARRLALARLLLRDAPIWLMDEPTEGLDGPTARDVVGRIAEGAGRRTLVVATHIRREAELADRLVLLKDGRLSEEARRGTTEYRRMLDRLRPD